MSKKTKIILISILSVAVICIVLAIILSNSKKYVVTFDTNGGSLISNQEVKKGGYVTKPTNPVKIGYNFLYWIYKGKEFDFTTKIESDITLLAMWEEESNTYQVSLEVDGKKQTVEVKEGELLDLEKLNFEEKDGYDIKWMLNDKEFDVENEKITDNITLSGEYIKVNTYTVTFNSDGGSKVDSQKVKETKTAKKPEEPTKDGYVFDAWYLNNVEYDFKEKVTKNITLKAKWIEDKNLKRYTVTFNSDGGSKVNNQTVIENKKVTKPTNPTKNGYIFVEWQLDGETYDFSNKVTSDITLKATWKQLITRTVRFNLDGGSCTNCSTQTVVDGTKATKPSDPTRANYVFTGWDFDFNKAITSDVTIKATWKQTVTHTVRFDLDGGSCTNCSTQTVVDGTKITKPSDPTRANYVFTGWNFDFSTSITSDITIKANWRPLNEYTVSFNTNGGTTYNNQTVKEGGKATNPGTPTRSGYTFAGWDYDFNRVVTSNITINAKWNEIVYTIIAEKADTYSTDATIIVKNGNTVVTNYKSINYSDGTLLCNKGESIALSVFNRETSFIVVLNDGTRVKATK